MSLFHKPNKGDFGVKDQLIEKLVNSLELCGLRRPQQACRNGLQQDLVDVLYQSIGNLQMMIEQIGNTL